MDGDEYDLVIIGGGSAGLTAAKVARFFAKTVALGDKERLGGDCLYAATQDLVVHLARLGPEVRAIRRLIAGPTPAAGDWHAHRHHTGCP